MSLGFIVGFLIMGKIVLMKLKKKGYSTLDSVPKVFGEIPEGRRKTTNEGLNLLRR